MAKSTYKSVDDYIQGFPRDIQKVLEETRSLIQELVPDAEETIKYDMPTFTLNGKNLVYFAAWKKHLGFYPVPTGNPEWEAKLANYKTGNGSIQFPYDKMIPYDLIKKLVKYRVQENKKDL